MFWILFWSPISGADPRSLRLSFKIPLIARKMFTFKSCRLMPAAQSFSYFEQIAAAAIAKTL